MENANVETFRNLWKSAYGTNPTVEMYRKFSEFTPQEIVQFFNELSAEVERREKENASRSKNAVKALKKHLQSMMDDYSIDRETAIAWEMEAHDTEDREYWLYCWGIGFNDMKEFM